MRRVVFAIATIAAIAGCRGQTSTEPPMIPLRGMHEMPRYDAQSASGYFEDGRTMREPVAETIPREMIIDTVRAEGVNDDGSYVMTIPDTVIEDAGGMEALMTRGQGRFDIYCTPCHAYTGDGNGMVTQRAAHIGNNFQAANLHDDRLRHAPDGQIFATISNGVRTMPSYRAQIPNQDRWAIVAYVRALQVNQASQRSAARAPARDATEAVR